MIKLEINILHLPHRKDRYENILKQSKDQGFNFKIWEGVLSKSNPKIEITKAHKRIIQAAKDNNQRMVFVAEDDFSFTCVGAWEYFINNIPESFDLFFGLVYQGTVVNNRVINGMSGVMTLYCCHERFYNYFLSIPDDVHVDRYLGQQAFNKEYYVTPKFCVTQTGGFSDNLRRTMYYDVYLQGKELYKG